MPIALQQAVAVNSSGGTTSLVLTPAAAMTAGNGLVVTVQGNPTGVATSGGTALTQIRATSFFGSQHSQIWYLSSVTGSPTSVTLTFASSTACQACLYEVMGTITANAGNQAFANTTAAAAGSFTTTNANTIAFAALTDNTISAQPSGYTSDRMVAGFGSAHRVYTSIQTSINPTWTNSTGGTGCTIQAFTSTNTTGPGVDDSYSNTLTWTTSFEATGVDAFFSDTVTWTGDPDEPGVDVTSGGELTWTGGFVGLEDKFGETFGSMSWDDEYSLDIDVLAGLNWTGVFFDPDNIVPLSGTWADTLTWSQEIAYPIMVAESLEWSGSFIVANPQDHIADVLVWFGSFEPDINLLAAGRYRR